MVDSEELNGIESPTQKKTSFRKLFPYALGVVFLSFGFTLFLVVEYWRNGLSLSEWIFNDGFLLAVISILAGFGAIFFPRFIELINGSRTRVTEERFGDLANREESDSEFVKIIRTLSREYILENGKELVQEKIEKHFKSGLDSSIEDWIDDELGMDDGASYDEDDISSALHYATAMDEKYQAQITRLAEQQTTSLRVGLAFAILGGVFLISLVVFQLFSNYPNGLETTQMILGNVLRALTVVFMEIFAFFFLRNYRSIFPEIKYYQNERNILQSKVVALRVAISTYKSKDLMKQVFESFLTPPSNQQFKKEKTTETVELERLQNQYDGRFFDLLEKALDVLGERKEMNKGK